MKKGAAMQVLFFAVAFVAASVGALPLAYCPVADESSAVVVFEPGEFLVDTVETELGGFVRYRIPLGGYVGAVGAPQIPTWGTLVAIPPTGGAEAELVKAVWDTVQNVLLYPVQDPFEAQDFSFDADAYASGVYPACGVSLGAPAIFRDLRVVPLNFFPLRYDAKSRTLLVARRMVAKVRFTETDERNALPGGYRFISEAFDPIYQSLVANYWFYRRRLELRRGCILYIIRDSYAEELEPLFSWRRARGFRVRVAYAKEDIGAGDNPTADELLAYIQNAYSTWEHPPEYVVFGGDCVMGSDRLPDYPYPSPFTGGTYPSDHRYSLVAGDDYLADIMVGRISVDYESEASCYAAKVVGYESEPAFGGEGWLNRGLVVGANCCGSPNPVTPRLVMLWTRELALNHGFAEVETAFCEGTDCPRDAEFISSVVNDGVGFIAYRGWGATAGWFFPAYYVSHVLGLSNGWMLPFVTSIVCGTGNFNSSTTDPCFGEAWIRAGSAASPKGAVDFYGPSDGDTHTKWNNPNCEGFYWGFLEEGLETFGQCVLRGKLTIYLAYPDDRPVGMGVDHYQYVYNIIGDPSVFVWSGVPSTLSVCVPGEFHRGATQVSVRVTDGESPVPGALVSVWFFDGDPYTAFTDSSGWAFVTFPPRETEAHDSASVVVTLAGYIPRRAVVRASTEGTAALDSVLFDDDATGESFGDGDGIVEAGEVVEITPYLRSALGALHDVSLRVLPGVGFGVVDSVAYFGDLPEGTAVCASDPVVVALESEPNAPSGSLWVVLRFEVADAGGVVDTVAWGGYVLSPYLSVVDVVPEGGVVAPGETTSVSLFLANVGASALHDAEATVAGGEWIWAATDSVHVPASVPGETVEVAGIALLADEGMIDGIVDTIVLDVSDGFFSQRVAVPVTVGCVSSSSFGGPDPYGYYCYDNTDTASGRIYDYDWIELMPEYGGSGAPLWLGDDETALVPLPFEFKYYGVTYDTIAICSNGWVAFGSVPTETYWNFYNRPIPDPSGPPAMVCPFWDDIDPSPEGCGVYYQYFPERFIFVVEWRAVHTFDDTTVEWFELILRDPSHYYYRTRTGDGEIIFQYRQVADIDEQVDADDIAEFSTVGIEEPGQRFGIEYSYCGVLAPHAAPLVPGRTIRFTTNPPEAIYAQVGERPRKRAKELVVRAFPNPFNGACALDVLADAPGALVVDVVDLTGSLVKRVFAGHVDAGWHRFVWRGQLQDGSPAPSGVYIARIRNGVELRCERILLLR